MARRSATSDAAHPAAAPGSAAAKVDLGEAQVAEAAQQVVDLVGRAGPPVVDEALQVELEVGQHARRR